MTPHMTGVLVAPPGTGKTVMACALIAETAQPVAIIVNKAELLAQWRERLATFLDLGKQKVGSLGGGKDRRGGVVDLVMLQSLAHRDAPRPTPGQLRPSDRGRMSRHRRPRRRGSGEQSRRAPLGGPVRHPLPRRPDGRAHHHAVRPRPPRDRRPDHLHQAPDRPPHRLHHRGNRRRRRLLPGPVRRTRRRRGTQRPHRRGHRRRRPPRPPQPRPQQPPRTPRPSRRSPPPSRHPPDAPARPAQRGRARRGPRRPRLSRHWPDRAPGHRQGRRRRLRRGTPRLPLPDQPVPLQR
ncbi:DEAD/DEAH box helicase family protein [Streptomyces violaceus]|uniref:DEAD/DEAH box helicase family protein n=1 Tax=Streptomyces violaceus TaxID=1936 RepID=UPI00399D61CE